MAEDLTIARPYAKAIFEQALSEKTTDEWEQILQVLGMVSGDSRASHLFSDPMVKAQQLQELFSQVLVKTLPKLTEARIQEVKNLLTLLIADKRIKVLPSIARRYQQLMTAERQLKEVSVVSAYPLDAERQKTMTEALARYLNSKVIVDFSEDSSLIGGVVIRTGNWVMDSSIKGKLQKLRDNLQE